MVGKIYLVLELPAIRHKSEPMHKPRRSFYVYDNDESSYSFVLRPTVADPFVLLSGRVSSSSTLPALRVEAPARAAFGSYEPMVANASVPVAGRRVYWGNSIAPLLIDYVSFQIGGTDGVSPLLASGWKFGRIHLQGRENRRPSLSAASTVKTSFGSVAPRTEIRYAPLRFFFCEHIGKACHPGIHYSNIACSCARAELHECTTRPNGSDPVPH